MELHLNYEQAALFKLERRDVADESGDQGRRSQTAATKTKAATVAAVAAVCDRRIPALKPKLKAVKETGSIEIDATTTLAGIPAAAWDYKLGNRSGLEWVLNQWKEHKISDPTAAAKFNTYRFADHKEKVIDLLLRICTVSVETMKIVSAMPAVKE
jgi:predicted helicase